MTVERQPVRFVGEIERCECGAHMQFRAGLNCIDGVWSYKHVCMKPGCTHTEWLPHRYPRVLVFIDTDGWDEADPQPILAIEGTTR